MLVTLFRKFLNCFDVQFLSLFFAQLLFAIIALARVIGVFLWISLFICILLVITSTRFDVIILDVLHGLVSADVFDHDCINDFGFGFYLVSSALLLILSLLELDGG